MGVAVRRGMSTVAVGLLLVGVAGYGRPAPPRPYALLRWDGTAWAERLLPDDVGTLSGVDAAGPSDVWTVGQDRQLAPYAAHFDGTTWRG